MSIELKEAAQQVLKELGEARKIVRASSSRQLAKDWDRRATDALANLREAIQQAEKQPATGEPVGYMNEGHIHELAMRRIPYGYVYPEAGAGASTAVYTHPSPSVPDDVVLKAKRYEWLKARNNTAQIGVGRWESDDHFTWLCDLDADEAIDAAMLAA